MRGLFAEIVVALVVTLALASLLGGGRTGTDPEATLRSPAEAIAALRVIEAEQAGVETVAVEVPDTEEIEPDMAIYIGGELPYPAARIERAI